MSLRQAQGEGEAVLRFVPGSVQEAVGAGMKWTEGNIAGALARSTFKGDLCVLPNCIWTGYEIDLLVVTPSLRIVDVEIKISRADLKADKEKSKWWREPYGGFVDGKWVRPQRTPRQWPVKTWKHYYAMPKAIWKPELLEHVQPISGVLLLAEPRNSHDVIRVECVRRATPCRDAEKLGDAEVIDIARLASLRMWDAYKAAEKSTASEVAA